MAIHRIQIDIVGLNANKLQTFHDNVEAQLAGKVIFDRLRDWSNPQDLEFPLRRLLQIRLSNAAQAQAVEDWIRNNIQTIRNLVNGTVSHHICPHDEPPENWYNCKDDPRANYREVSL